MLAFQPLNIVMRPIIWIYGILFALFYTAIILWPSGSISLIQNYGFFFILGLFGALVANSTGAGGGVVFIPFFSAFGFSATEALATSMAIQCFGMTAGATAWLNTIQKQPKDFSCKLPIIQKMLLITGPATIFGVLLGQHIIPKPNMEIAEMFRWFSIAFGVILFLYTLRNRFTKIQETHRVDTTRWLSITLCCIAGGVITSWISVGVGECIALLLFFLGFSPSLAVAIGVFTSSVSVLTGVIHHLVTLDSVSLEVVLFAGQAALIGGYLARHITTKLGGFYLKLFFAVWIFLSGIFID